MNMVICPRCHLPVTTEPGSFGLLAFICECGHGGIVQPSDTQHKSKQGKLALEPGRPTTTVDTKEEVIQRHTLHALCHRGYIVLQTSVRYKWQQCPNCGTKHRPTGGYGSTPGVPDLLVRNSEWMHSVWLGIEQKGTKTPVSAAQQELADGGHIFISRSVERALTLVEWADKVFATVPSDMRLFHLP